MAARVHLVRRRRWAVSSQAETNKVKSTEGPRRRASGPGETAFGLYTILLPFRTAHPTGCRRWVRLRRDEPPRGETDHRARLSPTAAFLFLATRGSDAVNKVHFVDRTWIRRTRNRSPAGQNNIRLRTTCVRARVPVMASPSTVQAFHDRRPFARGGVSSGQRRTRAIILLLPTVCSCSAAAGGLEEAHVFIVGPSEGTVGQPGPLQLRSVPRTSWLPRIPRYPK